MTIKVVELFSGIGAQAEALKELGLDYEVVATADIDKHAIEGYRAIHGDVNNLGDVTKIEHLPECDLLTYSWPCTSISLAGKREGMIEGSGTASSLLWEVGRLLEDMKARNCLPEVLVAENVDAVLNRVNKPQFDRWINILNNLGYSNSYQIMNAKDYGTPQNRRRMFMVSTLHMGEFIFPDPCPDGRVLRDVLEDDVPESFFLSEKRLATFKRHKERNDSKGNGFGFKVHELTDEEREREREGTYPQRSQVMLTDTIRLGSGYPKASARVNLALRYPGRLNRISTNLGRFTIRMVIPQLSARLQAEVSYPRSKCPI